VSGHSPWKKNGWRGVQGWKIIRGADKFSLWQALPSTLGKFLATLLTAMDISTRNT